MRTYRLHELMCTFHFEEISQTRIWPGRWFPGNHEIETLDRCGDCVAATEDLPTGTVAEYAEVGDQYSLAVHEAGHIVGHMAYGWTPTVMSLKPMKGNDFSAAHCWVRGGLQWSVFTGKRDLRLDPLTGSWAGQAAHLRLLCQQGLLHDGTLIDVVKGSMDDMDGMLSLGTSRAEMLAARDRADAVVADHWREITYLADLLVAHGELTGDQILKAVPYVAPMFS